MRVNNCAHIKFAIPPRGMLSIYLTVALSHCGIFLPVVLFFFGDFLSVLPSRFIHIYIATIKIRFLHVNENKHHYFSPL